MDTKCCLYPNPPTKDPERTRTVELEPRLGGLSDYGERDESVCAFAASHSIRTRKKPAMLLAICRASSSVGNLRLRGLQTSSVLANRLSTGGSGQESTAMRGPQRRSHTVDAAGCWQALAVQTASNDHERPSNIACSQVRSGRRSTPRFTRRRIPGEPVPMPPGLCHAIVHRERERGHRRVLRPAPSPS